MRILVVGGAGAMGRVTVRDLVASKAVAVGIADLDLDRAKAYAKELGAERAEPMQVDVREGDRLRRTMKDWDVVVNATWYELNLDVMNAAIDAGIHYVDLGGLYHMTLKQLRRHKAAKDAGVTCLLGMGATPGTMNVMAAYGATKFDRLERVRLRSASAAVSGDVPDTFFAPYSIRTILDEFSLDAPILRNGKIEFVPPLTGRESFELPDPVGRVEGYYTIHSELATLPQHLGKGLKEMDFIVAFDPAFATTLATLHRVGLASRDPVRVRGMDIVPYEVAAAVIDRLPKPKGPFLDVDIQRCEITGMRDREAATAVYDCISRPNMEWLIDGGSIGTGTPPSIAAQRLVRGKIKERGVVPPEVAVDPLPFFRELGSQGRTIEVWERDETERVLTKG